MPENGFNEYKKLITYRLDQLDDKVDTLGDKLDKVSTDVLRLRTNAGMWGAIGGSILTIIINLIISFMINS